MRDERFKATINHACQATLDPSLGGPQLLSITGITPGDYAMYAQLRSKRLGIARSPLAVRRATVVAVGPRGDATTFETLALGDHEDPRAVAWVAAFLKGAPRRQGARVDRTRLLSEPLAIEFVYDGSHALAAARSLNASVGDLEACAHLGTSEENDVGHLIGCTPLDARASEVSFTVGARLASPAVREALGRARSYDASRLGDGAVDLTLSVAPLAITAHAQLRSAAAGASATRATYVAAAENGDAPAEPGSGFPDLDALRAVVGPFETHIGGSLEKPRKQAALRSAVRRAAARDGARPLYCEVGFNAGYSSSAALSAGADVLAFDTAALGSVAVGADALRRTFPSLALEVVIGESCGRLETAVNESLSLAGGRTCDVVFVDGDHAFGPADCDIRLLSRLASDGATLLVDDVNPICVRFAASLL